MRPNSFFITELICTRINERMGVLGLTRDAVGKKAGISTRAVYKILQGEATVRVTTLAAVAHALQVSLAWLTGDAEDPLRYPESQSEPMILRDNEAGFGDGSAKITLRQAVSVIAKQLEIDQADVLEAVMNLVKRKG